MRNGFAVAAEWDAQKEVIERSRMHLVITSFYEMNMN